MLISYNLAHLFFQLNLFCLTSFFQFFVASIKTVLKAEAGNVEEVLQSVTFLGIYFQFYVTLIIFPLQFEIIWVF